VRRENLERHYAAEVAPVVAVGRQGDSGAVVADVLAGEKARPVRQDDVVFGEAFLRCRCRGNDNDEARTEPEREDLAVFLRKGVERAVERLFHLVEVSDYGEGEWPWRKVPEASCFEQEAHREEKNDERERVVKKSEHGC